MAFSSLSSQQRVMVLLELLGGPKFAGEMRAAAGSVGLLGKESALTSRKTFLATQALYTLRRYAFYGTIAVGGLAAGMVKLGYSYLSAMQTARVALGPVIKDHAVLEGYLNRLFKISKYSPFVITDLALSFRKMVGGFQGTGVGPTTILNTIQHLTDYLSVFGKVGPGSLNRVTQALIHMANVGRLTGRAVYQLGADGLPIYSILNKELGLTHDQLTNIAKLNIPAGSVLKAINDYARNSKLINGAALRISLRTFSGLAQVARDSLSQLSGALIGGTFKGGQSWLFKILKPGGPMDRLSNVGKNKGGAAAILYLSKQLTGSSGLGKGLLLLLSILKNIGRVFTTVIIPAWVMGSYALIVFYPILKLINLALGFLAKHSWIAKYALAALAAEFMITHFAILGIWTGTKLFQLATLGAIGPVRALIRFLRILRIEGFGTAMLKTFPRMVAGLETMYVWWLLNASAIRATTIALLVNPITWIALAVVGLGVLYYKWKYFHDVVNKTFSDIVKWSPLVAIALTEAFGPIGAIISGLLLIIKYHKQIASWAKDAGNGSSANRNSPVFRTTHGPFTPFGITPPKSVWNFLFHRKLIGHATGGFTSGSSVLVGERGPEIAHLPMGTRITPSQSVANTLNSSGMTFGDDRPIIVQLVVDREVLAEQVARAKSDKAGRR